ncbi:hypothetical protein HYPBUDRAFT_154121 [Hyphopichia burtonii NRRL Y-1933]|uniref:Uncharacterized protein n=1 Tax=Hyphopichia burtonii NRRL Y-1933 TaxID=984485 RepID=A0A1E4RDL4_9ASCO|nr:hypothetical protein HYPBUDRAFT_154121 [Hyphopichia burtonii NRRL Y-1933]ODV65347.1 hypothetical protein HYPBUDRAFT_154121 [Hyphopichia burtonii NRRL Y-1933]
MSIALADKSDVLKDLCSIILENNPAGSNLTISVNKKGEIIMTSDTFANASTAFNIEELKKKGGFGGYMLSNYGILPKFIYSTNQSQIEDEYGEKLYKHTITNNTVSEDDIMSCVDNLLAATNDGYDIALIPADSEGNRQLIRE